MQRRLSKDIPTVGRFGAALMIARLSGHSAVNIVSIAVSSLLRLYIQDVDAVLRMEALSPDSLRLFCKARNLVLWLRSSSDSE